MKNFLITLGALFASMLVIMLVQLLSGLVYPPPTGLDFQNEVEVARWANSMPVGAYLMVMLAYVLGSFTGGWIVGRFASQYHIIRAAIIGTLLMLAGFMNLAAIPHPLWFSVLSTISFIPMALLGAKLGLNGNNKSVATE